MPLSARPPGRRSGAVPTAASEAACTAVRAVAAAVACAPVGVMKIAPGNKTATGRASPRGPARPHTGRGRLTADELDSAKTSHTGEKPRPNWAACWAGVPRPRTYDPQASADQVQPGALQRNLG